MALYDWSQLLVTFTNRLSLYIYVSVIIVEFIETKTSYKATQVQSTANRKVHVQLQTDAENDSDGGDKATYDTMTYTDLISIYSYKNQLTYRNRAQ